MKRKQKQYSKPKKPYEKQRIEEEQSIVKKFGLKNKKEIQKAREEINSIREKAKALISASEKEQNSFFTRLQKLGYDVNSIADILSLDQTDKLKRRLQSVLSDKGMARSPRHARQLISHKKVVVNGGIVNRPSYHISKELEKSIELKEAKTNKEGSVPEENPEVENESSENKEISSNAEAEGASQEVPSNAEAEGKNKQEDAE